MTAPNATINRINATRAKYGFGPVADDERQWLLEEVACDEVASCWVRMGRGVESWKHDFPEMVELFDGDPEYRSGRIHLCDITDTWEEDYSLNREDFVRLDKKIRGWIVAHSRLYGRKG